MLMDLIGSQRYRWIRIEQEHLHQTSRACGVPGSTIIFCPPSRWVEHYLGANPVFPTRVFRENFRVPRTLFVRLLADIQAHASSTWCARRDSVVRTGLAPEVKLLVCLRRLGSAVFLRELYDMEKMGKETIRSYYSTFLRHFNGVYGASYLNYRPKSGELGTISTMYADTFFPAVFGP